jgi:predicted ATP-grasp superfamily ATP-dependent carboligase
MMIHDDYTKTLGGSSDAIGSSSDAIGSSSDKIELSSEIDAFKSRDGAEVTLSRP